MRTCVRATTLHRGRGQGRHRGFVLVGGGAEEARHAPGRRQRQDASALRARRLGDPHRALRPEPPAYDPASCAAARGDPRGGIDLQPGIAQAPPLLGGSEGAALRALRAGRDLAGAADGPDPRSHQRGRDGQSPRGPADRVPELRGDARDALREERSSRGGPPGLRAVRHALRPTTDGAAFLLTRVRDPLAAAATRAASRCAQGRAAAVRAARAGDRRVELRGGRAEVRRVGQRDPQWLRAYERELRVTPLPRAA